MQSRHLNNAIPGGITWAYSRLKIILHARGDGENPAEAIRVRSEADVSDSLHLPYSLPIMLKWAYVVLSISCSSVETFARALPFYVAYLRNTAACLPQRCVLRFTSSILSHRNRVIFKRVFHFSSAVIKSQSVNRQTCLFQSTDFDDTIRRRCKKIILYVSLRRVILRVSKSL